MLRAAQAWFFCFYTTFRRMMHPNITSAGSVICMRSLKPGESGTRGGAMERGGGLYRVVSLAVGLWMIVCVGVSLAQQAPPPATSTGPAPAEAPAAAPNLPAYFTATSDPQ